MVTGARYRMHTDAILTLAQWFSPGFPIGAFGYSHGLEGAVEAGDVYDVATLAQWLTDVLRYGAGRSDARFLAAGYNAEEVVEIWEIDAQCRAFSASAERLKETDLQGVAFCKAVSAIWTDMPQTSLTYPVAVGWAAKRNDLPLDLTAQMYLQAFTANIVAAGQRLTKLGQTEAQALIKTLTPLCQQIARDTADGDLTQLSSTSFIADIASMKHETQYARIFRT